MKKWLVLLLVLFMSVSGFAYNENNSIYIGFETGTYKYEEPHMEHSMSIKGHKVGASLEWIGKKILETSGLKDSGDNSFATFELRYITGDLNYKGYLQHMEEDPTHTYPYIITYVPFQMNNVPDWYIEGRITLGQTYNFMDIGEFWPYIGFGYRRLENNNEKVDPELGYKMI